MINRDGTVLPKTAAPVAIFLTKSRRELDWLVTFMIKV